jgi:hypothetical protein
MNFFSSLAVLCLSAFSPLFTSSSPHIDYAASLAIDGKTTHTYTVQFTQSGDTTHRITSYFDTEKRLVRQETTHFQEKHLKLYLNKIEDFRNGEILMQTVSGNRYLVQRRARRDSGIEQRSLTADNAIVTTLVSERVAQSLEELERGENVTFMLALPLHGFVAEMSLVKTSSEAVGGVPCVTIRLEPSNFIFKALMGEASYFTFERAKPHRFMQYKGVVGLPSADGKQQNGFVVIKY